MDSMRYRWLLALAVVFALGVGGTMSGKDLSRWTLQYFTAPRTTPENLRAATLSAITADLGTLTAGQITMGTGTKDSDLDGFQLDEDEIVGQENGSDQVSISASDGKLRAGGGNVVLDEGGIHLIGAQSTSNAFVRLENPAGTLVGVLFNDVSNDLNIVSVNDIVLFADDGPVRMALRSDGLHVNTDVLPDTDGDIDLGAESSRWDSIYANAFVQVFEASEDLTAGDAVWGTGSGTVGKTTSSIDAKKVVGVVVADATSGNDVAVAVGGKIEVTANEAIAAWDRVQISTSSAGRVAKLTTVTSSGGSSHDHSNPSTGTTNESLIDVAENAHTHPENGAGGNTDPENETAVFVTAPNHTHPQGDTGSESSHTHDVEPGVMLGKAITSAAGAGSTLTILITLGG